MGRQIHPDSPGFSKPKPRGDDVGEHIEFSKKIWQKNRNKCTVITKGAFISGYWILTHKTAWEKAGGFKPGVPGKVFLGTDNYYMRDIMRQGYKVMRMDGLYIYHRYERVWVWD